VRSIVDLVLTREDALSSPICALIGLSSFKKDLSRKSVPPTPLGAVITYQRGLPTHHLGLCRIRDVAQTGCAYLLPTTTLIWDECFQARENDGGNKRFRFSRFEILFKLDVDICG